MTPPEEPSFAEAAHTLTQDLLGLLLAAPEGSSLYQWRRTAAIKAHLSTPNNRSEAANPQLTAAPPAAEPSNRRKPHTPAEDKMASRGIIESVSAKEPVTATALPQAEPIAARRYAPQRISPAHQQKKSASGTSTHTPSRSEQLTPVWQATQEESPPPDSEEFSDLRALLKKHSPKPKGNQHFSNQSQHPSG